VAHVRESALSKAPAVSRTAANKVAKADTDAQGKDARGKAQDKADQKWTRVLGIPEVIVERDARGVARACLRELGRELGVPR
jgi:hypothetical protein